MAAPIAQHFFQYRHRLSRSWHNFISGYLSYSWMETQSNEVVANQQKPRCVALRIINYTKEMVHSIFSSMFRSDQRLVVVHHRHILTLTEVFSESIHAY